MCRPDPECTNDLALSFVHLTASLTTKSHRCHTVESDTVCEGAPLVGLSPCLGSLARFGSRRARSQPRPPREPRAMALSLSSDAFGSLDASRARRPTASKAAPFMAAFGLVTLGAAGVNFRRAPRPPLWSARRAAAHTANPTVPRSARLRIASRRRAASRLTTTAKRRRSRTSRRCSRATISRRRRAWP